MDAALALSAQSAPTLLPLTPGGVGTQQALLGYMFRDAAATSRVLAFSVGMQVATTAGERDRRRHRDLADAAPAAVACPPGERRQRRARLGVISPRSSLHAR